MKSQNWLKIRMNALNLTLKDIADNTSLSINKVHRLRNSDSDAEFYRRVSVFDYRQLKDFFKDLSGIAGNEFTRKL